MLPGRGSMIDDFRGARILITGVCGTIGRAVLARLLQESAGAILGIDNNETAVFELSREYRNAKSASFALGDIRNGDLLRDRMKGADYVFHTAAFKHVALCEGAPSEAIATNVHGTQNVIEAARSAGVKGVLFTSSDKAVNPTNVMGASKLLAERVMTAAATRSDPGTVFASTRFGNVLASRGSVVPVFADQIARGGPITVTDPTMTRFVMTIDEAADLVVTSLKRARGGEVFVGKMRALRIEVLAEVMRAQLAPAYGKRPEDIEIVEIGAQAGEKHYEELTNSEEVRRTVEEDRLFVVLPPLVERDDPRFTGLLDRKNAGGSVPYRSDTQPLMSHRELADYFDDHRILQPFMPARACVS